MANNYIKATSYERVMESGINFIHEEGKRTDFIITWQMKPDDQNEADALLKRRIFQQNLEKEGLELEEDLSNGDALNFLKIHAPMEVLRRYAEVLKIRMPIRKCMDELLEAHAEISGAEGDNMLEFKLTQVSNHRK